MTADTTLIDLHTHRPDAARGAIVSLPPADVAAYISTHPRAVVSTGVHPWDTLTATDADLSLLDSVAAAPHVVAIGETGLDALRGAPLQGVQTAIFEHHIELSEQLGKPLIIHCVKAWDTLLRLHRLHRPRQAWAIHGFRGNPLLARQLLERGMYLSLGEHFNPATAAMIPDDRLLVETDMSTLPIDAIIDRIAACRGSIPPVASTLGTFIN